MTNGENPNRREWLLTAGRNLVLAAMLAGIGVLSSRRGDGCPREYLCAGCPALRGCALPAGRRARQNRLGTGK